MSDPNEILVLELDAGIRMRLADQIARQMNVQGFGAEHFKRLNLGFELPVGWPVDMNAQPTLAQLIVLAKKLNLQIVISDLNVLPLKNEQKGNCHDNDTRIPDRNRD
jgi:hypothetical protein